MSAPGAMAIRPGVTMRKRRNPGVMASRLCASAKNANTSSRLRGTCCARSSTQGRAMCVSPGDVLVVDALVDNLAAPGSLAPAGCAR